MKKSLAPRSFSEAGFTIIELMTVMGVLAILLSITLLAINPARLFKLANDGKRESDVGEIVNAVNGYVSNNFGSLPTGITVTPTEIGVGAGKINLCTDLVPDYVASIPIDPNLPKTTVVCPPATGYGIFSNGGIRFTVYSLTADLIPTISMTK